MGNRYHVSLSFGLLALVMSAFAFPLFTHAASLHESLRASIAERMIARLCERQASLSARLPRPLVNPSLCAPAHEEPTLSFSAEPRSIEEGDNATLEWSSTHATSCTASDGWSGAKNVSGEEEVSPEETTTYTLSCSGPGGSITKSVTVTVTSAPEEPTVDITADPLSVEEGGMSELSWTSTHATECTASNGWSGDKATSGTETVSPSVTSTYAISCSGPGGTAQDSVTVTVTEPETATLTLVKTVVNDDNGEAVASDFQAKIDGENVAWGVAAEVAPGVHTASETSLAGYLADDWGGDCAADGSVTLAAGEDKTCTITNDDEPETETPTLTLSASRLVVNEGSASSATTTLTWDSEHADSCTASGGSEWSGAKALDGTETVTPTADVTYELDCTGAGGSVHAEVVIDFVPAEPSVDHILISEVYYDVGGDHGVESPPASANEWFELYNPTNGIVDLTNWWIMDATTLDKIPDGTTIPAQGRIVITATSTTSGFWGDTPMIVLGSAIGSGLANGGDALSLLNANGATTTVDAVGWGTDTSIFNPAPSIIDQDHSLIRTNVNIDTDTAADWADTATPTPGA